MKLILMALAVVSVWQADAQFSIQKRSVPHVKSGEVTANDLRAALEGVGLDVYSFDFPADSARPCSVVFSWDQYTGDSVELSDRVALGETYRFFTAEQGGPASELCDRIRIVASRLDSDKPVLSMGLAGAGRMTVDLEHKTGMTYGSRPFAQQLFEENKKIPLVMYGSFWEDENGIVRFCGSGELTPDDEMLRLSPHYYIISVEFVPVGQ